jgi:hypothetical protein
MFRTHENTLISSCRHLVMLFNFLLLLGLLRIIGLRCSFELILQISLDLLQHLPLAWTSANQIHLFRSRKFSCSDLLVSSASFHRNLCYVSESNYCSDLSSPYQAGGNTPQLLTFFAQFYDVCLTLLLVRFSVLSLESHGLHRCIALQEQVSKAY